MTNGYVIKLAVVLVIAVIAESKILHQKWVTTDRGQISITEIRADCQGSPLVNEHGASLSNENLLDMRVVFPNSLSSCAPSVLSDSMLRLAASHLADCYKNPSCRSQQWRSSDMAYRCGDRLHTARLHMDMRLELNVYCQVPDRVSLINLSSSTVIRRHQGTCPDSRPMIVRHIFTRTSCAKPLRTSATGKNELARLANALNSCLTGCDGVDISDYQLEQPECMTGNEGIGIYWACGLHTTATVQSTNGQTAITSAIANQSTEMTRARSTSRSVTTAPGTDETTKYQSIKIRRSKTTTTVIDASETGELKLKDEMEMKYLKALIVVSVLLLLVILLLIGIVIYFIRNKRKGAYRKYSSKSTFSSAPPSRQALYSTVSEARKLCDGAERPLSNGSSGVRYEQGGKVSDGPESNYAEPHATDNNYGEADDTYEVVDTDLINKYKQTTPQKPMSSTNRSYGYMIPVRKPLKPPTRTPSEKYSNGYLVPTVSQKS